jgi:tRNA-Thr(GGU) m(6)t(6)A37 methyltransferase TsaA
MSVDVRPIGTVESRLVDVGEAPNQGDEGAPDAVLVIDPVLAVAVKDLRVGDRIVVVTWLHQARRDVLEVHPRGDERRSLTGVFSTRSSDRPNPIGLHTVEVLAIDGVRVRVSALEAIDGTPILDIKPVLGPVAER